MDKRLDSASFISNQDKSEMLRLLDGLPSQCWEAFNLPRPSLPGKYKGIKKIVFSGMGGSAIGADLIRSFYLYELALPVFVIRNYRLPAFVDRQSLFFACSYSGNTEETISSFKEALKRGAKVLVFSSDGRLVEMAKTENLPFILIPRGYPPRAALGYAFFTPLRIIQDLGFIPEQEKKVKETVVILERLRDRYLSVKVCSRDNLAKKLALALEDKFPVIYGCVDYLDSVVARWRAQLAENSKTLASSHLLPELNHNEIVGWRFPEELLKKFEVIILRDKSESKRMRQRIEITKRLIRQRRVKVRDITSWGDSLVARMFSLIYIGDYLSFYLAILNHVDPTAVRPIDYLKRELSQSDKP